MQGSKFEIIYLSKVKTCFDDSNTARNYEDNSTEQAKYQLYFYYFGIYKCHSMMHDSSIYILPKRRYVLYTFINGIVNQAK
jgi:hypothetical protein